MTNDLAKAEALFKSLKDQKKEAAAAVEAAEAATKAEQDPASRRRRVRIRDVSAIRPAAPAEPEPEAASAAPAEPDGRIRLDLAGTLKQLRRPEEDDAEADDSAGSARRRTRKALQEAKGSAGVTGGVINAFQIRIAAPTVKPDGDMLFVIEGDDVAQVASDALVRVAEYMGEKHPGASWSMQGLERLPLTLAPRN